MRSSISKFSRKAPVSGTKREAEESTDETPRVEADFSPASAESPPRTRARLEAVQMEDKVAAEARETADEEAEKVTVAVVRAPPMSPSSQLAESPARELFPVGQDQALPEAHPVGRQEVEQDEAAGLAEELLATARRATESAEVSAF